MTFATEVAAQRIEVVGEIRRLAPDISKDTEEILADMYSAKQLDGTASNQPISLDPRVRISIAQGAQINQLVRQSKLNKSLEIGFAYGFSTVWILDGMRSCRSSRHLAIDPHEITHWGGVGLRQVKRLHAAPGFEWIDEYSVHALSGLIKNQEKFDFIFIDGIHRFGDVLVDFYLSDRLVLPGGLVALDDLWMPSIRTVISFILTNRQYKVVSQPVRDMMVLRKIADDNRNWDHFEAFVVHKSAGNYSKAERLVLELARVSGMDEVLHRIKSKWF
jgi:predicted O-methyltransferase YrrM